MLTPFLLYGLSTILSNEHINPVITTFVVDVFPITLFFSLLTIALLDPEQTFAHLQINSLLSKLSNTSVKHFCQICHKIGHTADMCWHMYDPPSTHSFNANMTQYAPSADQDSTPSILGAPSTIEDSLWYPNSGATHHVTNDSNIFTNKQIHHGGENLKLSNDQGVEFLHIGFAHYIVSHTNTIFVLRNLLHVPKITKSPISVSQFARDNHVYFEFLGNTCYVKHQETHQILLQGKVKECLYVFPPSNDSHVYTVNHVAYKPKSPTLQLWHNRLGHSNFSIVKCILSACKVSYKTQTQFCNACLCGKFINFRFKILKLTTLQHYN